ncbi:MAG: nitroreductase family protein [Neisseriaceae bacterium]|nr:nitroreductase family protein [Neisseriaceae bacterium]MBP6860835.1 nitroreductase family protein [Neisseriaceae bacterium]
MNPTIQTLTQHRTYRDFDPEYRLDDASLEAILAAAQQAPAWRNAQHYSIINIKDADLRAKIVALQPLNPQIGDCAEFLIFCADLYKTKLASDAMGGSFNGGGHPEAFINAISDTSMAFQNAVVAAESLGLAICPIGGLRAVATELIDLLNLPQYVYPIVGLCIGKPSVEMRLKPRLPLRAVYFDNQYDASHLPADLADYEATMTEFGEKREKFPWRQKLSYSYDKAPDAKSHALLKQQGFLTYEE